MRSDTSNKGLTPPNPEPPTTPASFGAEAPHPHHPMATAETHVPPQNLEAEASVLGAMMVSEGAIAPVILDVRLRGEDFYRERHRIVFRAITSLYEQSE